MCPYLRLDADGVLRQPADAPTEAHRCVAIAGPIVLSTQQQQLLCLQSAHVDCPRYHRTGAPKPARRGTIRPPAVSRAIVASLVVLAVSAAISFGFVVHRGGIDLTPAASAGPGGAAAVTVTATPAPANPAATAAATPAPTDASTPVATPAASAQAIATASQPPATPAPTRKPTPAPRPTPTSTPGAASASRLAVLKACQAQAGCYVYTVRAGDNLFSIAHWFGVPLPSVYAMNPTVQRTGIHAGMQLRIPTPTR